MAKKKGKRKSSGGGCKRVKVCGNMRVICRKANGRITSNKKG